MTMLILPANGGEAMNMWGRVDTTCSTQTPSLNLIFYFSEVVVPHAAFLPYSACAFTLLDLKSYQFLLLLVHISIRNDGRKQQYE